MIVRKAVFSAAMAAVLCLWSCGKVSDSAENKVSGRDIFAMDTYMSLKVWGSSGDKALDEAEKRIYELERELSAVSEESDIYRLNHARGEALTLSDDAAFLIKKAVDIGSRTEGALDITVYPIVKEWGFTTGDYKIPKPPVLGELLQNVDYRKIHIDGNKVRLPENAEIDLGALAKGYTGDEIMKIMEKNGVTSAIVSLGGNVQALGSKPDGSDWRVAVRDPFSPDRDMCVVETADRAVVTSGNYERFFVGEDGNRYCHIIDPKNGCPSDNGLVSVTVIGESGLECDALSTALFVMGWEKAAAFASSAAGYDVILVTEDKRICYTDGISDSFENISEMPAEVIAVE